MPNAVFRPSIELMTYLDGNLSSNGLDDPALSITKYLLPWWTSPCAPTHHPSHLTAEFVESALIMYRSECEAARISSGAPHPCLGTLVNELNKPAYMWHSSTQDGLPNSATNCTRCRLYRAVAVGVVDQLCDTYNMFHACEIANQADKDVAIRRASGFNELYDAALKKECSSDTGSGSGVQMDRKRKGKEKARFGTEVEDLKEMMKDLMRNSAAVKWTWGVDLTEDDLCGLI